MPAVQSRPARRTRSLWPGFLLKCILLAVALVVLVCFSLPRLLGNAGGASLPDEVPAWVDQELLPINPYSRPGTPLEAVNGVVIHYTGNPGTTAEQNRSYFAGLALSHETYASSQFLIDMDGSVIQCVPVNEIAYCSSQRNADTLSIEVCHPDESGRFTEETQASLTRLVQWACDTYGLARDQILRHYDVTGKECPRYFVDHPDAWETFLDGLNFPA